MMEAVSGLQRPVRASARRQTTHALVVDEIRAMILGGELKPGDRLRVDELANALGVSPMPVREALHQLAAEGTATLDPFRGFSINELSAKEAVDLYSTRAALETLATRIAVARLDKATLDTLRECLTKQERACRKGDAAEFIHWDLTFHRTLYTASDRPLLTRQILGLITSSVRYSRANLPLLGSMEAALAAHRTIFDACERRDAALAAKVTRQHTEQAAERVLKLLAARDQQAAVNGPARVSEARPSPAGFHHIPPQARRSREARVPGSTVNIICDAATPAASLISGVNELAPGAHIPLHFHDYEELQFILSGEGVALDADGREYPLGPGSAVYCAAGRSAAHGFRNTGTAPLAILYAYATPGAAPPALEWLERGER